MSRSCKVTAFYRPLHLPRPRAHLSRRSLGEGGCSSSNLSPKILKPLLTLRHPVFAMRYRNRRCFHNAFGERVPPVFPSNTSDSTGWIAFSLGTPQPWRRRPKTMQRTNHPPYFSSQARPSVIIFTSLPPLSGFTKIVSAASPRLRFSIAEAGVIRSLPSLVHPWALRFADNSAQTLFTLPLLLNPSCSTSVL